MRILILGLGQYPKGSGVQAALYFARRGDQVTVYDFFYTPAMDANIKTLKKFKNVRFVMGKRKLEEVAKADLIVKHQRIRSTEPEVVEAMRLEKPMESELSIFLKYCPCKVIGITGTRGKSTTTALTYELLKAGLSRKVWLGGNILLSPLTFLHQVKAKDLVVLEVSSFQLEGTGMARVSPQVAVWTNLMPDHLNAYPSMKEYAEAKAQIFRHQKPEDTVFLPAEKSFSEYAKSAPGHVIRFGKKGSEAEKMVSSTKMLLLGEHNVRNAVLATEIALFMGVKKASIKKTLRTFKGLPNRLEVIAVKKGIRFVNDTTATTPDATKVAIEALKDAKHVKLIFGGADKELRFEEIADVLKKQKDRISLFILKGTAEEKIRAAFAAKKLSFEFYGSMKEVFVAVTKSAKKGETVLLSPGCASFGLFQNEYDRGEQFVKLVKAWK